MLKSAIPAPPEARVSPFYLRFGVLDVSGVLAEIARHLSNEADVSIESMIQRGPGAEASRWPSSADHPHECAQPSVERALKAIAASDKVLGTPSMIPIEAG